MVVPVNRAMVGTDGHATPALLVCLAITTYTAKAARPILGSMAMAALLILVQPFGGESGMSGIMRRVAAVVVFMGNLI
jgi:hypothetical protein